jgi:hypothetical protein
MRESREQIMNTKSFTTILKKITSARSEFKTNEMKDFEEIKSSI